MTKDVKALIAAGAAKYGLDADTMLRIASVESEFNPNAYNESGASGVFQFIPKTWGSYGGGASPFDAEANIDAGMRLARDNRDYLRKKLGREPTGGEIYLAHQQGAGGAINLLSNASRPASQVVKASHIAQNLPAERRGEAGSITAGDFAALWSDKLAKRNIGGGYTAAAQTQSMTPNGEFHITDPLNSDKTQTPVQSAMPVERANYWETFDAKREAMRKAEEESPSLFQGALTAIKDEWSILAPFRYIGGYTPDPDYKMGAEEIKQLGQGVPSEYLDAFDDAVSAEHATAIRDRLLKQIEDNRQLQSMGATGTALRIAAAMTDPAAIAATVAAGATTGGAGGAAVMASRLGKAGSVGLAAGRGVAANMLVDTALIGTNDTRDWGDLKYSIGAGLAMGVVFNGHKGNIRNFLKSENEAIEKIAFDMMGPTKKAPQAADNHGSMGAGVNSFKEPQLRKGQAETTAAWKVLDDDYKLAFGKARVDLFAQMARSKNPVTRNISRYLVEDAVGSADTSQVRVISASEQKHLIRRTALNTWATSFNGEFAKFKKANGVGLLKENEARNKFSELITDYVRAKGVAKDAFPPEVKAAGQQFDRVMKDMWQAANDAGITRSDMGLENYVPRVVDKVEGNRLINKFGGTDLDVHGNPTGAGKLFAEAIKSAQMGIEPALADKMGRAIAKRILSMAHGDEIKNFRGFGEADLDDFADFMTDLRKTPDAISEADEAAIMEYWRMATAPKEPEAGGSSHLKHRILMDEDFAMKLPDEFGGYHDVSVKDFYLKNSNVLMHLYTNNMSGQIALAKVKVPDGNGGFLVDGLRNENDLNKLIHEMKGANHEASKRGEATANLGADEENIRFAWNAIMGIPNFNEHSTAARSMRMLRDFNFVRLMGQVGFSQIPELGRQVGHMGFKTTWQALPEFRNLIKMARSSKITDDLGAELDDLTAVGRDFYMGEAFLPTDDFGVPIWQKAGSGGMDKVFDKSEEVMHRASRAVVNISGMHHINTGLQRWTARSFAVKMANAAMGRDKGLSTARMAFLGLDATKTANIHDAVKRFGEWDGKRLKALGVNRWPENARRDYTEALFRMQRNIIQENDVGQFSKAMLSPMGKVILQFRTFAVGAYTRGLLQGLNMRDMPAALGFMYASAMGSLVYAFQTNLQTLGASDRNKSLADRLSPEKLAIAGFTRSAESSIVPMLVDTLANFTTGESVMDFRSSGLPAGTAFGNPSVDLLNQAGAASSGILTSAFGDDYSKQDARSLNNILPFQRTLPMVWAFNWLSQDLKRELKD